MIDLVLPSSASQDFWSQAISHTRSRSPATFEQWFSSIQYDGLDGDVVRLVARDEFVRDWVREHFLPTLLSQLREMAGRDFNVEWSIASQLTDPICPPRNAPRRTETRPVERAVEAASDGVTTRRGRRCGIGSGSEPRFVSPAAAPLRLSLARFSGARRNGVGRATPAGPRQ